MTNKATSSNRPVPSRASSAKSEASSPSEPAVSPAASCPPLEALRKIEERLPELRDEDFAAWGAYVYEDLGVIELDRAVGGAGPFGARLRAELTEGGRFKEKWVKVAVRLNAMSPAAGNPSEMLAGLCMLAAAHLFVVDEA